MPHTSATSSGKPKGKSVSVGNDPHPVSIRFAPKERKAIEDAAERDGLRFGAWVRQVAVFTCERGQPLDVKRTKLDKGVASDPMSIRFTRKERQSIERSARRDEMMFGSWVRQAAVLACEKGLHITRTVEMKKAYKARAAS